MNIIHKLEPEKLKTVDACVRIEFKSREDGENAGLGPHVMTLYYRYLT